MSAFLSNVVQTTDDFIWDTIVENIPKASRSNTGFLNFRCPMCADYKPRCGVRRGSYMGINCYNCGFATRYTPGKPLTVKMRDFLERIGVDQRVIGKIKHQTLLVARALESVEDLPESVASVAYEPSFKTMDLPDGCAPLSWWAEQGCVDEDFLAVAAYALSRGDHIVSRANFQWTPLLDFSRRIIMPFTFRDKVVGYTARAIDEGGDKYKNKMQTNYLYNNEVLDGDGEYIFIVEGPTDALAIGGVSPLGAKLNAQQIKWISSSGKTPVIIGDRDKSGRKLIEIAQKNKWAVSFPCLGGHHQDWWDEDIKDCDEAVKRHGRIYTIRAVIENITTNPTEIEIKKKKFFMEAR